MFEFHLTLNSSLHASRPVVVSSVLLETSLSFLTAKMTKNSSEDTFFPRPFQALSTSLSNDNAGPSDLNEFPNVVLKRIRVERSKLPSPSRPPLFDLGTPINVVTLSPARFLPKKTSLVDGLQEGNVQLLKHESWGKAFQIQFDDERWKRFMSGIFSSSITRTLLAPLETIRIHVITGSYGNKVSEISNQIMSKHGWKGLFHGNGVNLLRVFPTKVIELYAYNAASRILVEKKRKKEFSLPIAPVAGAFAGLFSTLLTYPLDVIKTRLTVQGGSYRSLSYAIQKIVHEEGLKQFYKGLTPSLLSVLPYAAIHYSTYLFLRKQFVGWTKQRHISDISTLFIGSFAATVACIATYPLEVTRKRLQLPSVQGNFVTVLTSTVKNEGLSGLYHGLNITCIKLLYAAGISYACYEACKVLFKGKEAKV